MDAIKPPTFIVAIHSTKGWIYACFWVYNSSHFDPATDSLIYNKVVEQFDAYFALRTLLSFSPSDKKRLKT